MMTLEKAASVQETALKHKFWKIASEDEEVKVFLINVCKLCDSYYEAVNSLLKKVTSDMEALAKEINTSTAKLDEHLNILGYE